MPSKKIVLGKVNLHLGEQLGTRYIDADMFGCNTDDFPCSAEIGRYLLILEPLPKKKARR